MRLLSHTTVTNLTCVLTDLIYLVPAYLRRYFCCEVFVLLLKAFACLEADELLDRQLRAVVLADLLYVLSDRKIAVLYIYLV